MGENNESIESSELWERLEALEENQAKLLEQYKHHFSATASTWQIRLGPIVVRRTMPSQVITWFYLVFLLLCAGLGTLLILLKFQESLGVALIAGPILALGTFVGQVWAQTVQRERALYDHLHGEEIRTELNDLMGRIRDNQREYRQLAKELAEDEREI